MFGYETKEHMLMPTPMSFYTNPSVPFDTNKFLISRRNPYPTQKINIRYFAFPSPPPPVLLRFFSVPLFAAWTAAAVRRPSRCSARHVLRSCSAGDGAAVEEAMESFAGRLGAAGGGLADGATRWTGQSGGWGGGKQTST